MNERISQAILCPTRPMSRRHAVSLLIAFLCGVAVGALGPTLFRLAASRLLFPEHRTEVVRLTSPDGRADAVAERIECGAPCSSGYAVSVVPKGVADATEATQRVFLAGEIVNPQLKWSEPHVLDIAYDKALIESFRNVAYPLGRPGNVESWGYAVEILLSASSCDKKCAPSVPKSSPGKPAFPGW